jgi:hypothetical protein
MIGSWNYQPDAADGEAAVLEDHPRLTAESDFIASPGGGNPEQRVDSTAFGTGASDFHDRPSYPTDPGLRRFVRRGLRVFGNAPVFWAHGRTVEMAPRPVGQGGFPNAAIEAGSADRTAPIVDPQSAPDTRPWYDTAGAFQ